VHCHRPRGNINSFTVTHALVGAFAVDFDGAHGGRFLHDVAGELGNRGVDKRVSDIGSVGA